MKRRSLLSLFIVVLTIAVLLFAFTACKKDSDNGGGGSAGTTIDNLDNAYGATLEGGAFPEGSILVTTPIDVESDEGREALEAVAGQEYNVFKPVYIFDISVVKDNADVQPNGKVKVSIPVTADLASYRAVLHIKDDGTVERLSATYADGKLTFETDSFSVFILIEPVATNIHTHNFSKEWSQNETHHWHACLGEKCNATEDYAEHYYGGSWDVRKEATEAETGLVVRVCIGCKYEDCYIIPKYDPDHVHTFEETWSKNEYAHWYAATCAHVNETKGYVEHDWDDGEIKTPATLEENGIKIYTCTVCGKTKEVSYAHEHTFSDDWTKNDDYHWHASTCGHTTEVLGKAEHSWNNGEITTTATADKDGVKTYTCTVCGATKEETIVFVPHTHAFAEYWTKDDDYHWHACTSDDCTDVDDKAEHTWGEPVVKREPTDLQGGRTEYTCTVCGRIKQVDTPHEHIYGAWQFAPSYHWQIANCGPYTGHDGIRGPESPHVFKEGYCKDCGIKDPSVASEGLEFTLQEDDTYYVSGIGTCTDIHLVIPSTHEGKPVTGVADDAFRYKSALLSVYLPDSVKTVGNSAFYKCSRLNSIRLPDDMTRIGEYAFSGCKLYTLTLPTKGLSEIEKYAFSENYEYLLSIYIPDNITTIGERAFYYCREVKELRLPETMASLGESCFEDLQKITSITIPKGIKELPKNVFAKCYGLTEVTIPNHIEKIGEYAFSECKNLTTVRLFEGLTCIEEYAFESTKLTSVTIPSSITELKTGVFARCAELTEVVLHEDFVTIGKLVFTNCTSLTGITLPSNLTTIGEQAFQYSALTSIVIPEKITVIGRDTFSNCKRLTSVTLPEGLRKIDERAFYNCTALDGISIPNGVTEINSCAFQLCSALTTVNLPTSLKVIANSVFNYTKIKSVVIPDGVTAIEESAFRDVNTLESVTFGKNIKSIGSSAFENCTNLASISLPSTVEIIGSKAFAGCKKITTVLLPSSLEKIEYCAFSDCTSLTTVTIPSGIKQVEYSVFKNTNVKYTEYDAAYYLGNEENPYLVLIQVKDTTVTSCTINTSTVIIAGRAFYGSAVTEIYIPDSVKVIGHQAFNQLKRITLASIDDWCMIKSKTDKIYAKINDSYEYYWGVGSDYATAESRAEFLRYTASSDIFREGFLPSYTNASEAVS